MPTPKSGYKLKSGEKVPGVTTIIGRFKESGPLIAWAFSKGKEGVDNLYEITSKAADIGSAAHRMVEMHLDGHSLIEIEANASKVLDNPDKLAKAVGSFQSYLNWERNFKVNIIAKEVYMVSEVHKFGGTPDAIGEINGKLCLLDWKTSNGLYADYLVQVATYEQLWNENNPSRLLTGGLHLLRFSKEHGDFTHKYFPNLDKAWRQFLLFREAYEIDKELKARVK